MQNRQSKVHTKTARKRLLVAVITAFSLIAASGMFTVPAAAQGPGQFVFQGAGWGHGVGMSQNGARNAATSGVDHVGILNFYYPNTIVSQVGTLENIRVHIGDATRVELSSAGAITFERGGVAINAIPSGSITVSAHDGGLQIGNAWTTGSPTDPLFVSFPQPVRLGNNGHSYLWGKLQITNKNGKVRVVEVLPLEQYVAGIAEMPAAWPLEALMAQAIAARTYAHEITLYRRNSTEWAQEYDISGSTVDQNYIGYDAQDSAWDQKWLAAVSSTAGHEIIDNNGPVRAYYSASNGGYTETAAYVFNNDVAHTVAGPDPYDAGGHDWTNWTRTYTQESMSRWLNSHADTSVGTVTSITVAGGAGASARIDKSVVEIVGTAGTKRVTGKRLMLVINAGVFGEGGGLSTHLPGTFTTIGNGAGAGAPQPTGAPIPTTVTPDPIADDVDENAEFTPPPGWQPEPGTGVSPTAGTDTAADAATAGAVATEATAPGGTFAEDGTYIPPAGWEPASGTGVAPGATPGASTAGSDATDSAPADAVATASEAYTPPADWQPAPGTGVAPSTADASADSTYTPPADWKPEPGTGLFPNEVTDTETVGGTGGGYAPPAGWAPTPGTGVAPSQANTTTIDFLSARTGLGSAAASAPEEAPITQTSSTESSSTQSSSTESSSAQSSSTTSEAAVEAEVVVAAETQTAEAAPAPQASSASSDDSVGGTGGGYTPPSGWTPVPGTGVPPSQVNATPQAQASGVFLVTRSAAGSDLSEAKFEVIAPTEELAAEARERLTDLQTRAAIGLFADVDIDGYVASVAPRPVHGVCTATATGVTCVPIESLQATN